jgi:site-specific DNA-adenine methylase
MRGPLAYIGGKRAIAKQIIDTFPTHKTFVEAFAGGAQVFFKKEPSKVEVLNDLDGEMVNFFRVCQQHYEEIRSPLEELASDERHGGMMPEVGTRIKMQWWQL